MSRINSTGNLHSEYGNTLGTKGQLYSPAVMYGRAYPEKKTLSQPCGVLCDKPISVYSRAKSPCCSPNNTIPVTRDFTSRLVLRSGRERPNITAGENPMHANVCPDIHGTDSNCSPLRRPNCQEFDLHCALVYGVTTGSHRLVRNIRACPLVRERVLPHAGVQTRYDNQDGTAREVVDRVRREGEGASSSDDTQIERRRTEY